jgi:hypothetical protein
MAAVHPGQYKRRRRRRRRKRWAFQDIHMKERKTEHSVLVGKPEGPDRLENLSIGGRITLRCRVREKMNGHKLHSSGYGQTKSWIIKPRSQCESENFYWLRVH